jgi:hypothetical protein
MAYVGLILAVMAIVTFIAALYDDDPKGGRLLAASVVLMLVVAIIYIAWFLADHIAWVR